ncbi:dihydrolipoyllysine-residue succinyltransferase component of 2-oxoglutarate dehydrogenase complex [Aliidongia dinghuensis]|uniref:Dihydrolipoyllysine-residue succinyltransferase component of 2-oxoglutarate dehydrogenase complex n=1 Tax=Aliidongia dinghuensis TaxID=1867774 RepID=A0A8J2YR88_9PROT|nr:2-oxoglutarate dehydrogenase complex dihydrolipoyllysine-residue succinyltransferase [Aliidongia dinghuensis]GGF08480.1 dihydrolipoyllysine-residue succinyltransferase component of 2-oxoglutarate dehydrogenase complex [Aliidongia dinghuensis]
MATEIKVPPLGESVTEGTVARWLKKVGDSVKIDETLIEFETDKVTVDVPSPATGVLSEISAPEGANVAVGGLLGVIAEGAAGAAAKPAAATAPAKVEAPKPAAAPAPAPAAASAATDLDRSGPAARKLVAENQLDATSIPATGKDGRLTKGDVLGAIATGTAAPAAAPAPAAPVVQAREAGPREQRVKMTRLRQRIAQRLKEAQNTAAMLTTFNEVDMTAIMAIREQYKDAFEKKHGVKLGFMSFFVKACIAGLKELPAVNAEISGDELIYKNYYDIGVAVGTESGLVVPVVRDADVMSFSDIEKQIGVYGKKARDGKLSIEELTGGTFTISNGGVYGSLMSTPILNPPQSAILGMHKTQKRPVAIGDKVEIRPMMYLALSYDHRIIDGREAVTFLVRVKENLEDPQRLLLDM